MSRRFCWILASVLAIASPLHAQQDQLTRAFELERRGNYTAAAEAYRAVLKEHPADPGALLGLERALTAQSRPGEIIPEVRAALATRTASSAVFGVALRAWGALDQPDSAHRVLAMWTELQPNDEAPYREWMNIALTRRDRQEARQTVQLARERLGRDDALAAEMAQLAMLDGDYATSAREWTRAIQRLPGYRGAAINSLAAVTERGRPPLLHELTTSRSPEARQLAASLTARWGDPVAGFGMLNQSLPENAPAAIELLRQFVDLVQPLGTRESRRAQAMALEALAGRSTGAAASRFRTDAGRLYAESGDSESARRMLGALASDRDSPRGMAADAGATLVTVLLEEGKVDQAAREYARHRETLTLEQRQSLGRRLALGWGLKGELDRADSAIAGDSTVEGFDLAGRLRLFRGDLAGARELLRAAGPFAGTRFEATSRTALLALLQPIEEDSLPDLGTAMLRLAQGDTTQAIRGFSQLAGQLPPQAGGAELWLTVGRLQAAIRDTASAEASFRRALRGGGEATTPAAALDLARLLAGQGRTDESIALLEDVILNHSGSAVVPQARRLLDELRGAVPRT